MAEPPPSNIRLSPKEPSFLMVVAMSAVVLIIILIVSYFLVGGAGKTLMPGSHPSDFEPTSQLMLPMQTGMQRNV